MHARSRVPLVAGLLGLALAACSSGPTIRTDADPAADFSAYETFAFFEPLATDKAGYSTLLTARLKDAARRELEARGYTYDAADPDLLVNFNVNVVEKTEVRSSPSMSAGYGYYGYRGGMYGAWSGYPYDVTTTNYRQGTLTFDAVDAERKALVWQGGSSGRAWRRAASARRR
jgi:hypothetical protein